MEASRQEHLSAGHLPSPQDLVHHNPALLLFWFQLQQQGPQRLGSSQALAPVQLSLVLPLPVVVVVVVVLQHPPGALQGQVTRGVDLRV
jgi:hypothetical protein